jgi:hypothetical protein
MNQGKLVRVFHDPNDLRFEIYVFLCLMENSLGHTLALKIFQPVLSNLLLISVLVHSSSDSSTIISLLILVRIPEDPVCD